MNIKKLCTFALAFSVISMSCLPAYADAVAIDSISAENVITLDGSINYEELGVSTGDYEAFPYYPVSISLTCTDPDGTVVYVDQTHAYDDGVFTFVFDVTDIDNTELKAIINTPFGEIVEQSFAYENKSVEILNREFASLDDKEAVEFLKTYSSKLGISTMYLEQLEDISDVISEMKSGIEYSSKSDFKAAYSGAVLAGLMRVQAASQTIIDCINSEGDNLGQVYYLWSERTKDYSPEQLSVLIDEYIDFTPRDALELETIMTDEYIEYFFKTTQYYADYSYVFDNEHNFFDLTKEQLEAYDDLGVDKQDDALEALYDINRNSAIDDADALDDAVDKALKTAQTSDKPVNNSSSPKKKTPSSGLGSVSVPVVPQQTASSFSDVSPDAWFAPAVNVLASKGIINGKGNGTFEPNSYVTRAEFAQMLYKMLALTPEHCGVFADVSDTDWYSDAVNTLYAKGIVNGMGAEFGVNLTITRQDMAVMLYNAAKFDGIELQGSKQPADTDDISDYAKEGVFALLANGILNGYEDESFNPLNNLSRAEAAQALYSFINHREG